MHFNDAMESPYIKRTSSKQVGVEWEILEKFAFSLTVGGEECRGDGEKKENWGEVKATSAK